VFAQVVVAAGVRRAIVLVVAFRVFEALDAPELGIAGGTSSHQAAIVVRREDAHAVRAAGVGGAADLVVAVEVRAALSAADALATASSVAARVVSTAAVLAHVGSARVLVVADRHFAAAFAILRLLAAVRLGVAHRPFRTEIDVSARAGGTDVERAREAVVAVLPGAALRAASAIAAHLSVFAHRVGMGTGELVRADVVRAVVAIFAMVGAAALAAAEPGAATFSVAAERKGAEAVFTDALGTGVSVVALAVAAAGHARLTIQDRRTELFLLALGVHGRRDAEARNAAVHRTLDAVVAVGVVATLAAGPIATDFRGGAFGVGSTAPVWLANVHRARISVFAVPDVGAGRVGPIATGAAGARRAAGEFIAATGGERRDQGEKGEDDPNGVSRSHWHEYPHERKDGFNRPHRPGEGGRGAVRACGA